jgi:LPS-assembly protein
MLGLGQAPSQSIAATHGNWADISPEQLANTLGWVSTTNNQNVCHGYYQELPITMPAGSTSKETHVRADRATLEQTGPSTLEGHVVVTQPGRQITGDKAVTTTNPKTHNAKTIDLYGNVKMREPGIFAVGDSANVVVSKNQATLHNSRFRLQISPGKKAVYDKTHQLKYLEIKGKNYRGQATNIEQTKPKYIVLNNTLLTTCNPFDNIWKIKASEIHLDRKEGVGRAYNSRVLFYGVPIFYSPYLHFPLDNRRRTGFLSPDTAFSSRSGFTIGLPFYINMAPNYDMTLYPYHYAKRGNRLGTEVRYLTDKSQGAFYYSFIQHDKVFDSFKKTAPLQYNNPIYKNEINRLKNSSDNRYQIAWRDQTQYTPGISSAVDFDFVNDDYYLQDFGDAPIQAADPYSQLFPTTQLAQTASVTYNNKHLSLSGAMENFQTLHPVTLPATADQYARLPEIDADIYYPDALFGLDYTVNNQFSAFRYPWFESHVQLNLPSQNGLIIGERFNSSPTISYYGMKSWGYINPKISFDGTEYQLSNLNPELTQPANPVNQDPNSIRQRAITTYDIDSGLYFDRKVYIGTNEFTQTLEPRLFYVYTPYTNQDKLPIFDTSLISALTYDQLFAQNRFNGIDRIGDTNHITAGLTSRFLNNKTGNDALDMSISQIYYFANRRVQLNSTTAEDTTKVSPLVGQLTWQLGQFWNTTSSVAYNEKLNILQNANTSLNYKADNTHIFTANFSLVKTINNLTQKVEKNADLEQIGVGSTWALNNHWQAYGAINYNLSKEFPQTYLYGIQYNSCCWQIRALNSKHYIGLKPNNGSPIYDSVFYLQFVLTGLTSGGSGSAQNLLQYSIPGYKDNFGQQQLMPQGPR